MPCKRSLAIAVMAVSLCISIQTAHSGQFEDGVAAVKSKQYAKALTVLLPLANEGNAQAQRVVGEMAYQGQGMRQDLNASFKWNEVAADGGDMLGQYNLGYLYERGEGVAKSRTEAINAYMKAAVQGYVPAQLKLGELYSTSNRSMAMHWYRTAMEAGDPEGRKMFSAMGTSDANDREAAQQIANKKEMAEVRRKDALFEEHLRKKEIQQREESAQREYDAQNSKAAMFAIDPSTVRLFQQGARQRQQIQENQKRDSGHNARPTAQSIWRTDQMASSEQPVGGAEQVMLGDDQRTNNKTPSNRATKIAEKLGPDVVEPNPYERYETAPNSWGSAKNGWLGVKGHGTNRKDACSSATTAQTKWIASDEANGYVTAAEQTGCICGTYSTMGNMNFTEPQWVCGAYHRMKDTGKKRGNVAR